MLLLGLDIDEYFDVSSIIVHRSTVRLRGRHRAAAGTMSDAPQHLAGQAHCPKGPVVLSWAAVRRGARSREHGQNVVYHEFAHRLDMLDGDHRRHAPARERRRRRRWADGLHRRARTCRRGESVLRPYAAPIRPSSSPWPPRCSSTGPMCSSSTSPTLYGELRGFYRQDPSIARRRPDQFLSQATLGATDDNGVTPPWRPAGISFTLRLLTLLLVPLVGLGVLAVQRIDGERDSAATALALVEDARRQQDAAAIYGPAQLEQIALEGLASVDDLGLPRDLVVSVTGVDFEATYDTNQVQFDTALDRLANQHGDFVLDDGTNLGTRLGSVRTELAAQRQLSTALRAERNEIRRVFAELHLVLTDSISSTLPAVGADTALATTSQTELAALSELLVAAGARGEALLDALVNRSEATATAIVRASARLDFAIEPYSRVVDANRMAGFQAVTESLQPIQPALLDAGDDQSLAEDFDTEYITVSAGAVLAQLAFQTSLETYSNDVHTAVVDNLEAQAIEAESNATQTQLLLAITVGLSGVILILLSWTTLRPLRRLTKRALAISDGAFEAEPLPIRGPSDVRTLTNTMNAMTATLQAIDDEIADLATGTPVESHRALPGAIGVSLAQSFERLGRRRPGCTRASNSPPPSWPRRPTRSGPSTSAGRSRRRTTRRRPPRCPGLRATG